MVWPSSRPAGEEGRDSSEGDGRNSSASSNEDESLVSCWVFVKERRRSLEAAYDDLSADQPVGDLCGLSESFFWSGAGVRGIGKWRDRRGVAAALLTRVAAAVAAAALPTRVAAAAATCGAPDEGGGPRRS